MEPRAIVQRFLDLANELSVLLAVEVMDWEIRYDLLTKHYRPALEALEISIHWPEAGAMTLKEEVEASVQAVIVRAVELDDFLKRLREEDGA